MGITTLHGAVDDTLSSIAHSSGTIRVDSSMVSGFIHGLRHKLLKRGLVRERSIKRNKRMTDLSLSVGRSSQWCSCEQTRNFEEGTRVSSCVWLSSIF